MRRRVLLALVLVFALAPAWPSAAAAAAVAPPAPTDVPLPEHPRPDFERALWLNLNGEWSFRFDASSRGEAERWFDAPLASFPARIRVPYPWGSPLSGVKDEADVAWYARAIRVPEAWAGKRVFLVVGASDWKTTGWLDGQPIGDNQGGYTPFEMELTKVAKPGVEQRLVLRVDDTPHPFKLEGKQGYGKARGIWQTAYLEARPAIHVDSLEVHPSPELKRIEVQVRLSDPAPAGAEVRLRVPTGTGANPSAAEGRKVVAVGAREVSLTMPLGESVRPWSLDDPYLYDLALTLVAGGAEDHVKSYFGLRSIGTGPLPGLGHPYVTLNGRPVYLQMTLDQSWNAGGYWNWPSDEAIREEILIARRLGLNAIRAHVKVEVPRKLYWADRLGVLVMADVPNSWGEPDEAMRREWETAFRGMVRRDFNHPSVFSWVLFNEQWGLLSKDVGAGAEEKSYRPDTQEWVGTRYDMAKKLDPTRLVEDNSPCCGGGHVRTDLNSWHMYLPGWRWKETLDEAEAKTSAGSTWNYVGGRKQDGRPMMNSECGNVWGYEGSTGDVDWSFEYHAMIDEFRRHPKVAGWLYTEHHDVVNEWNGYVRADRSPKETGLSELFPGMTLADLHAPLYVAVGRYPATAAKPGERVSVPLWASFLSDQAASPDLVLRLSLVGTDDLGREREWWRGERQVPFAPWTSRALEPVTVTMPERPSVAILRVSLEDATGRVLQRNFTTFVVGDGAPVADEPVTVDGRRLRVLRVPAAKPAAGAWTVRRWDAMEGRKQNGAGSGYFEYRLAWPKGLGAEAVAGATFVAELGAKELFGKDRPQGAAVEGDFMKGQGTHDPGLNPNAYPMTDTRLHSSAVRVRVNGAAAGSFELPDDPADHRGVVSWLAQKREAKPRLSEAGSYGYLVQATVPAAALAEAARTGELVVRLEVDPALPGGLAVYGAGSGRYAIDPTVVLTMR
jgi:hypothetical protein